MYDLRWGFWICVETTCKYEAQATERKGIGNRKKENAVQWSLNFWSKRNGYTQASIRENFTYLKRKSVNSQLKAQPNKILQSASVIRTSLGSLTTVGNTGFTGHCQNNPWQREKKQSKIAETRDYSELMRTLRIWTRDLQIFSLTLSQLSYLGIW